jgi:hypothetical protein
MLAPKRGDVVLYSQGGKTYNALVLAAHALADSHLGKNGEPLLHLSVPFDDLPGVTRQPGSIPEPTTVHDVVHTSHEFSQQYMESHGLRKAAKDDVNRVAAEAEIRNRRGAGEWTEVSELPLCEIETDRKQAWSNAHESEAEVKRLQKLVSDLTSDKDQEQKPAS